MSGRVGSITTGIVSDGLVFNMDAANRASYPRTGTTATDTVNNVNGTLTNDVSFNNNNKGVFDFDGTDDFITFGSNSNLDVDYISCFFWNYRNSAVPNGIYLSRWGLSNNWNIIIRESSNNLRFQLQSSGGSFFNNTDITLSNGSWNYYGFTFDGVVANVYQNGSLISSTSFTGTLKTGTPQLEFGDRAGGNDPPFNGQLGPVHIYNRALSANEVLHNYNALKGRFGL
jgi:hypothetical protein